MEIRRIKAERSQSWMVSLLEDLREVARRDKLDGSVAALTNAIVALRFETAGADGSSADGARSRVVPGTPH